MRSTSGHALHDYAIALALVAVLGLGGLQLLGGNIKGLFEKNTAQTTSGACHLFSLVGASTHGAKAPGGSNPMQGAGQGMTATLKIDPNTGEVIMTSSSGSGTNVTSVDGATAMRNMSEELAKLADFKTASGQPLPPDIQDLIKQLGAVGTDIGQFYGDFSANKENLLKLNDIMTAQNSAGQYGQPPYYNAATVQGALQYTNNYLKFAQVYGQLNDKLSKLATTDPGFAPLQKQVNDFSGGISSMAHANVGTEMFSNFHIDRVQLSDVLPALSENPLAAEYFTKIVTQTGSLSPAEKERMFQQFILNLGQQNKVGTDPANSNITLNMSNLKNIATEIKTNAEENTENPGKT